DETVGSGVSRAGGEENIFLYSCLKHNLRIIYLPVYIGTMHAGPSQWFKGFNEQYFFERGVATRKMMGKFRSSIYALYFLLTKYKMYKNDASFSSAFIKMFSGIFLESS